MMLFQPVPIFSGLNLSNARSVDAMSISDGLVLLPCCKSDPNIADIILSQFHVSKFLLSLSAVQNVVCGIFKGSGPSQMVLPYASKVSISARVRGLVLRARTRAIGLFAHQRRNHLVPSIFGTNDSIAAWRSGVGPKHTCISFEIDNRGKKGGGFAFLGPPSIWIAMITKIIVMAGAKSLGFVGIAAIRDRAYTLFGHRRFLSTSTVKNALRSDHLGAFVISNTAAAGGQNHG